MLVCDVEMYRLVESIWSTMLGFPVEPTPDATPTANDPLTGSVQITGAWQGAVLLDCDMILGRRVAASMFDIEPDQVSKGDIFDAIGEVANMLGGNVKALLPESCHISLPAVVEGPDYTFHMLDAQPMLKSVFTSEEDWFRVTVLKADDRS